MKRYETLASSISGKMAQDLAHLLGEPLFAVDPKQGSYGLPQSRKKAFNRFCRLCVDAGVSLPDLEPELIDCYLPQNSSEKDVVASKALADEIESRMGSDHSAETGICYAVATMLTSFPNINSYGGIEKESLIALANRSLLKLGEKPIRPEYPPITVSQSLPPRLVKILIVDDEPDKILETAIALAGWPNVEVEWLRQQADLGYSPSDEKKDAAATDLAKAIVDRQCDIVLMDQGLRGFDGHLVVKKIRESVRSIVFVANTGGSEDELMGAGCVAGARKGEKITEAMRVAFDYLS